MKDQKTQHLPAGESGKAENLEIQAGLKEAPGMPGFIDIGGGIVVERSLVERIAAALGVSASDGQTPSGR